MKLTKYQKARLLEFEWDVISNDHGNCAWISIDPSDGAIFGQVAKELDLTGDGEDIKLLVVATKEGE